MEWIDVESGERPADDETVLGKNDKFPNHLPDFVCWFDEEQEFMPICPYQRLPVKITHYCKLERP